MHKYLVEGSGILVQGYLVLENGKVFKGTRFGATGDVMAEVVFTTSMTGYLETLTNKSNAGQMVVQTFPMIGNYGVIPSDFEADEVSVKAYIVNEWCQFPSNFRNEGNLDAFFVEKNVVGLSGIDTRALTKMIRTTGSLNACITNDPASVDMEALKNYQITGEVSKASTKAVYTVTAENETQKLALLDFGVKKSLITELTQRGCTVTVYPHDTKAADILATKPDGIVLSGGPGNPMENELAVLEIKELLGANIPMFATHLGHQLLALAHGFTVTKMAYGHRGSNQPIRDTKTGKVYLTAQSHQYAVTKESIDDKAQVIYEHINDLSPEGLFYEGAKALSLQFYPEAASGPLDTKFLFDQFVDMLKGGSN